jgi:protocatechuate 3,4-dioxygenase beta subunit
MLSAVPFFREKWRLSPFLVCCPRARPNEIQGCVVQNSAMPRLSFAALCALAIAGFAAPAGAQVSQQIVVTGAPDGPMQIARPGEANKTGSAVVRGRVVAMDTGQPIRRAQLRLVGSETGMKSALTDASGRYEFKELPAGRVTLTVSKGGFVQMQYGQTRPFEPGRPIELSDGQVLDKVDVALPRGSVITGRVVDEFGEPVTDVMVSAMRMSFANGRRRLVPAGRSGQTNDIGQFRIYGLAPGDYYVSATYRDLGVIALDFMTSGSSSGSGSQPTSGYAPTYFPGTPSPGEAQRVSVAVGQEMTGIDISLLPVKLARVTGQAVSSDGRPLSGATIMLMPDSRDNGILMPGGTTRTNGSGQFTLNGVAPGDYSLQVRSTGPMMIDAAGGAMMFSISGPDSTSARPRQEPEFASVPVSVNGENISGLVVVTTHGATATGRVVFEGGAPPEGSPRVRISAPSADPDGGPTVGAGSAVAKEDGTFELTGLAGARMIRPGALPKGWVLDSVRLNGADITDTGHDFKPGEQVGGLEIVLTQQATDVTGAVTDTLGQPLKEYTVVLFSTDQSKWTLPMTRWRQSARPDQDGRFEIRNLPAGTYYAIAVTYVAQDQWADPDWLTRAATKATTVTVNAGTGTNVSLKLVNW